MTNDYTAQLIKTHIKNTECVKCFHFSVCSRNMGGMDLVKCKDYTPTADVEKVKYGNWIDRAAVKGQVYCSECLTIENTTDSNYKSKRCPNCGAIMNGGKR